MSNIQGQNRLQGDMPKIGIRPTIDGRRGGIRESLENVTMMMARSVASLLSKNLRHSNGLAVEQVFKGRGLGQTISPMATLWKQCFLVRSFGMGFVSLIALQRKTIH